MTDRENVIKGIEKVWDAFNHMEHELYADYVFNALALLKAQPDIVRCKDCRRKGTYECPIYAGDFSRFVLPDEWFCADGERKE